MCLWEGFLLGLIIVSGEKAAVGLILATVVHAQCEGEKIIRHIIVREKQSSGSFSSITLIVYTTYPTI